VHNSSVSPCEGTDPEGKAEGTGNLITATLEHFLHENLLIFYVKANAQTFLGEEET
jgi:hypothetical protein